MKASITKRITSSTNSAPAVRYPVGRSSFQGYFLLVISLAGCLVGGLWIHSVATPGNAQFLYFAVLIFALLLAGEAWRRTEAGHLEWSGESWTWKTADVSTTGSMAVHLDIQAFMVVTLTGDRGQTQWLWLERVSAPMDWRALRRSIYADKQTGVEIDDVKKNVKTEVTL